MRLNMQANDFNSVLIERGDRVAIQGDGHPTIDAALVAFSSFALVKNVLQQTDSSHQHVVDDNIMAYPLYWCLSAMNYVLASGDLDYFRATLISDIQILLDKRIHDFLDPNLDITWFGWDDRIGNGWCFHSNNDCCTREALLAFSALVIRVCNDFIHALQLAGQETLAKHYLTHSQWMIRKLRQVPEYPRGFGIHAAANVLNAFGVATRNETNYWMSTTLNDPITICSFSQFNQYWILQAFGNVGDINGMEHALASIKLCWGPMMKLGKGCFWEMSCPEWMRFMEDGDQPPHLPSFCHPWASGVTPWLTHVLAGLNPVLPGYKTFVALPYVSATHLSVSASVQTRHGILSVNATLNDNLSFRAHVDSAVSGIFGLRLQVLGFNGIAAPLIHSTILVDDSPAQFVSYDMARRLLGTSGRQKGHVFVFTNQKDGIICDTYLCVVQPCPLRRNGDGPPQSACGESSISRSNLSCIHGCSRPNKSGRWLAFVWNRWLHFVWMRRKRP